MALFPCAVGLHKYGGPQHTIYFSQARGSDASRWKLRLCGLHIADIQNDLAQFEVDPEDLAVSPDGGTSHCVACFQPTDEGDWQFFATSYPAKDERKDYWGHLHVNCVLPDEWHVNRVPLK